MLLFLSTHIGYAAELEFAISQGIERTDNVDFVPTNETGETIYTTRLGVTLNQDSPKLDAQVEFMTEYRDYRNDTFDDQNVPSLLATVNWAAVPERFTWFLRNILTQEQIDDRASPTPDNEQDVNTFTTGPDFFFRISQSDAIQFGLRYTDSYFEKTEEDSERYSQTIVWQHELSSRTGVSLNFANEAIEFDNDFLNKDFDRQDWFFRLDTQQARNELQFDIGETSIEGDRGEDESEPLARFSWKRRLSDRSNLGIFLVRELSDTGRDVAVGRGLAGLTGSSDGADLFTDRRLNAIYTLDARRTTIRIGLFYRKQDFKLTDSEDKARGINIGIKRNVSRKLIVTLLGSATRTEFVDIRRVDDDVSFGAALSYRLGRALSFNIEGEWNKKDSDNPLRDYDEKRATFQIAYNTAI